MKRIYLVRHGETVGNVKNFSQLPETELTEKGHAGAQALAERFAELPIDKLFSSPYTRAQQTAAYIADTKSLTIETLDSVHENLRPEVVRGKVYADEVKEIYSQYFIDLWEKESDLTGMETYVAVLERVEKTLHRLAEDEFAEAILVSHSDFLRMLVTRVLVGADTDAQAYKHTYNSLTRLHNVAISVLEQEGQDWKLSIYNDHAHFADN